MVDSEWVSGYSGTTIGYKKIVHIDPVKTDKIKIVITEANNTIALAELHAYKLPASVSIKPGN